VLACQLAYLFVTHGPGGLDHTTLELILPHPVRLRGYVSLRST
jgi:hypothetical protein